MERQRSPATSHDVHMHVLMCVHVPWEGMHPHPHPNPHPTGKRLHVHSCAHVHAPAL